MLLAEAPDALLYPLPDDMVRRHDKRPRNHALRSSTKTRATTDQKTRLAGRTLLVIHGSDESVHEALAVSLRSASHQPGQAHSRSKRNGEAANQKLVTQRPAVLLVHGGSGKGRGVEVRIQSMI